MTSLRTGQVGQNRTARSRTVVISTLLLVVAALMLSACKPDADAMLISPQLGEQMVAAASAGPDAVAAAEPTPVPVLADLTDEEIVAGLPDDFVTALAEADPANGETLSLTNGCVGCHALDPEAVMTGPTWHNMGDTAVGRVDGQSPALYLYNSIVEPNSYVNDGYPAGVMPQTYADTLSTEDLADVVAYLLSQNGQ